MNKKVLISLVLTSGIIFGGLNLALDSKTSDDTSKSIALEASAETKITFLSDDEAVSIASNAMKDYLNIDANCFSGTEITRYDRRKNTEVLIEGQKYMVDSSWASIINWSLEKGDIESAKSSLKHATLNTAPSTIFIKFIEPDNKVDEYKDNEVTINAETGEIIRISKHNEFKEFKGEVDKNKIKETIINFLEKLNLKVDSETNWDKMNVFSKEGAASLCLKVNEEMSVEIDIDLEDYSIINFYKVSIMYPNEKIDTL